LFKLINNRLTPPPLSCSSISNNWYQRRFLLFQSRSISLNMTSLEGKNPRTEFVDQKVYRPPQRRQTFLRYKNFFYGYCFFCSNFGHKAINCSLRFRYEQSRYSMNNYLPQQRLRQPSNKHSQIMNHVMTGRRTQEKHNNRYEHNNRYDLLYSESECYICQNYGHKEANCHLKKYNPDRNLADENIKV
jgi:hypothetical protein